MRAYLFIAVMIGLCLLSEGLKAQSIMITDPEGNALSYAFIAAERTDGSLITKGYCDENGQFVIAESLENENAQMRLVVSYLGYMGLDTLLNRSRSPLKIRLLPDQNYLQEAVVTDQYQGRDFSGVVQKVEVISAAKMEDMAAINLSDVLSNEMNIRLGRDQALGTTGLQMMGIGGQNVKILIDGVPVIGRLADQLDLSQLNINNIERIEIVQGPMSVSYGTNALAGAINIITKKKTKEAKELRINAQMESMNQYNTFGHLSWRSKQHQHMLTGGRNFFGGWSANRIDRTWDWLPKEQYYLRYQYLRKIRNTDFQWRTDGMRELILNRGIPRVPYGEEAFDLTYTTWRFDNAITMNSKWKKNRYFNLIAANNHFYRVKNRYLKDLVTLNETITTGKGDQDTTSFNATTLRATYSKESNDRFNYQLGIDANYEIGRGERIENGGSAMLDAALFSSVEWKPHRLITVRPGLRYGFNSLYNLPLIASLQTKYMNKKGYVLRLSVGNGFRAPGLKELYLDFIDATHDVYGNPDLKAEQSINYMLSAEKDYQIKHGRIKPSVNLFYNRIQDKIELVDLTTSTSRKATATYFNISDFRSHGVNMRLQGKYKRLDGSIQYGLTGIRTNLTDLSEEQQFLYNSQWNSSLGLRLPYDMKLSLFVNYFGQLQRFAPAEAGSITLQSSEGFSLTDVTLRKAFKRQKLNLSIGVRNLFNITNIQSNLNTGGAHSGNATGQQAVAMGRIGLIKLDWTLHGKEK